MPGTTSNGMPAAASASASSPPRPIMQIFMPDSNGRRPVNGDSKMLEEDRNFRNYALFYEYFHGDSGKGLGASHQTGWTGLVAKLIQQSGGKDYKMALYTSGPELYRSFHDPVEINGAQSCTTATLRCRCSGICAMSLQLTGSKFGCGMGLCGACTVHVNGEAQRSCLTMSYLAGKEIVTIEGLSANGEHPVQRAWQQSRCRNAATARAGRSCRPPPC